MKNNRRFDYKLGGSTSDSKVNRSPNREGFMADRCNIIRKEGLSIRFAANGDRVQVSHQAYQPPYEQKERELTTAGMSQ